MTVEQATRTPLFERHVQLGAQIVEFAGHAMPLSYTSIREEHLAVRAGVGIFDLSHMGEVRLGGPGAIVAGRRLFSNDVARIAPGAALYSPMCSEDGGIVDDVVVYRDEDGLLVVVNAGCRVKDVAWIRAHCGADVIVTDESEQTALIAVQGPRAVAVLARLARPDPALLRPFHWADAIVAGANARVSRTGYTGEDGFELYLNASDAGAVWDALLAAGSAGGLLPVGLGARDTLRLEAGLRLYGQDMDETTDPFSCGLGWTVRLGADREFIGEAALRAMDPANPPRHFVGLTLPARAIARHGQEVRDPEGEVCGTITSGTYSFSLSRGIATALLTSPPQAAATLNVDIRGTLTAARVVRLPFYRRPAKQEDDGA